MQIFGNINNFSNAIPVELSSIEAAEGEVWKQMPNLELGLCIERWALNVERWTFASEMASRRSGLTMVW